MARVMTQAPSAARTPTRVDTRSKPVYLFALLGAVIVAAALSTWGQWIASPDFRPSPMGPDPLPTHVFWTLRVIEVLAVSVAFIMIWKFMIQPWRREGHITWDGRFMIASFIMWVTDPIDNYFNFSFMYNAGFFNMASWTMFIPGWEAPNQQNFPEPLFFVGGLYIWWFIGPVVLGCWGLRRLHEKYSNSSMMTRLLVIFAAGIIFDFVIENIFQVLQVFKYVSVWGAGSVWAGTEHQYPLYNSFMMSAFFLGMICLRFFRDDQGNSWAERGIDQIQLPNPAKGALKQFAIIGALFLNISVMYYAPFLFFSMKNDTTPHYPSYLIAEICGERTAYACPDEKVPVPSRSSLSIAPDDPRLHD